MSKNDHFNKNNKFVFFFCLSIDNSEYSHFQNIDLLQTIGVWLIVGGVFIFIVIGCCCCRSKMSKTDKRHISYSPLDDNLDLEEFGEIKWDKQS